MTTIRQDVADTSSIEFQNGDNAEDAFLTSWGLDAEGAQPKPSKDADEEEDKKKTTDDNDGTTDDAAEGDDEGSEETPETDEDDDSDEGDDESERCRKHHRNQGRPQGQSPG
jgi:hypothetical protein